MKTQEVKKRPKPIYISTSSDDEGATFHRLQNLIAARHKTGTERVYLTVIRAMKNELASMPEPEDLI